MSARGVIAEGLSRRLGQQIVVEPKPGAAGTLAAAQIARATPDGYHAAAGFRAATPSPPRPTSRCPTIRSTTSPSSARRSNFPFVIVTYPEHTIRNIPDLIKAAKARSEPLLGGVPGAGTPQHLLIEYFSRLAGIKIQVGAVPRRQPGADRAARQAARLPDRSADRADRPDQVRRAARHRRHRRQALCAAAGRRHHRRGRLPRIFRHVLDGHGRPGQAAGGRSRRGSTPRSTR